MILFILCLFPLQVFGIELKSPNYIIYDKTEEKVLESSDTKKEIVKSPRKSSLKKKMSLISKEIFL